MADPLDPVAMAPLDDADAIVLASLADVVAAMDPVPSGLADRCIFTIATRDLDQELALLVAADARAPAGVRAGDDTHARTLSFSSDEASLTLMVSPVRRDRIRIDGWVADVPDAHIRLRLAGETRQAHVDADGRFVLDDVPTGMLQVVVVDDDEHVLLLTPTVQV